MMENFLTSLWRQGAFAGAKPDTAFAVQIGLVITMTADEILNGYLRVKVLLAISCRAEFIAFTFHQQQQEA